MSNPIGITKKSKSVLDNVPVNDLGWQIKEHGCCKEKGEPLFIVGRCPSCDAPVYGPKTVLSSSDKAIPIRYGCSCRASKGIAGTMRTT